MRLFALFWPVRPCADFSTAEVNSSSACNAVGACRSAGGHDAGTPHFEVRNTLAAWALVALGVAVYALSPFNQVRATVRALGGWVFTGRDALLAAALLYALAVAGWPGGRPTPRAVRIAARAGRAGARCARRRPPRGARAWPMTAWRC